MTIVGKVFTFTILRCILIKKIVYHIMFESNVIQHQLAYFLYLITSFLHVPVCNVSAKVLGKNHVWAQFLSTSTCLSIASVFGSCSNVMQNYIHELKS